MLRTSYRTIYSEEHDHFRDTVRKVIAQHLVPNAERWEREGIVDREFWERCGEAGMLCPTVPEEYGGLALDFRYNAIVDEEIAYSGYMINLPLQSDIVAEYIGAYGSHEQKLRWLPGMVTGQVVTAIAMTEPGTGSDLRSIRTVAKREGDHYLLNGSKTYITNGQLADLVVVAAKTESAAGGRGLSLLLVEGDRQGFRRGRRLEKIGQWYSDTSELFFENVRIPVTNCLGEENKGLAQLMKQLPQERLSIAVGAQAGAQKAFDITVSFVKERRAFGKPIADFQNTRFLLADMAAKLQVGWAHLDQCLRRHVAGELAPDEAAAAKLWHTETQWSVLDACVQLHGGAGYMNEYEIARLWRDGRVQRIYGGTSEIMRELVGRSL